MDLILKDFSQAEWRGIISQFRDVSLIQTWEYGKAKRKCGPWKVARGIFLDQDRVLGAWQALLRPIPLLGGGIVWINRGPLWRRDERTDLSVLQEILGELRRYWVDKQHMYLLIAPPLLQDESSSVLDKLSGYNLTAGIPGWGSARMALMEPLEVVRKHLQPKWRNCLNKAERLNVLCECGCDDPIILPIINDYEQMLREKPFTTSVTPDLLRKIQETSGTGLRLWGISGKQGEQRLGGIIVAQYAQTGEYLVAVINEAGKKVNANYILLWQALGKMKELGCHWFDVGGMHSTTTPAGIFHFKAGLGGDAYQLAGQLEASNQDLLSRAIGWYIHHRHGKNSRAN